MKKVWTLAVTTFQELIREKFFVVGLVMAFLLVALSYLLGSLSFYEQTRILFNIGTMGIELVLIGLALFSGSVLIHKEIELRTCQIILTRPLSRTIFLLGKWTGLLIFIFLTTLLLGLVLLLLSFEQFSNLNYLFVLEQIFLKVVLLMSLAFFMGLVLRPVLASLVGLSLYLLSHSVQDIQFFLKRAHGGQIPDWFLIAQKLIPRFDQFNWKSFYFIEKGIPSESFAMMNFHYLSWIFLILSACLLVWRKKDIG
jgi:Cu-processing system permease protein